MRYNNILNNKKFISLLNEINDLEKDRIFCSHGIGHLFDVARTAYIICLENGIKTDKDIIYAAALLHDIGRAEEYKGGRAHNIAGAEIAEEILAQCSYNKEEIKLITDAIRSHRVNTDENTLAGIIFSADKLTRPCFMCNAEKLCNWDKEKKNFTMRY